jgi:mRNA-degrading endonuclease RelE of RelBE toxin-antitoxin system
MDKIEKALNRLGSKVRQKIKSILLQIEKDDFRNLDLKKLKGRRDIFRIRKGDIRIIIHKTDNSIKILSIEHRSSKTYRQKRT